MKKNLRMMLSLLLVLVFVFQFGGMALADDVNVTLTGKEALVYELLLTDSEGKTAPLSAEEEADKLGGSCSVSLLREGSEEAETALSRAAGSATLEDLVKKGLAVKVPEGFCVSESYLRGDAVETQQRKSLPFTAYAEKTDLLLKAGAVGDKSKSFDKRFLTTASTVDPRVYTLVLVLSPLEKEKALTVTLANDSSAPGSEQQLNPGESFTAPEAPVPNTEDLLFSCWQVKYPSGGVLKLNPGESFKPYANCRVEGKWTDVITVTANAPVEDGESFAPNGYSYRGHLAEGDAISSVSLDIQELEDGFVAVPSEAVIMNGEENVTDRYELRYVNSDAVRKDAPQDDPTPAPTEEPTPEPTEEPTPEPVKITITAQEPVTNDGGKTYEQNGAALSSGALNEGDAFAGVFVDVQQREDGSFVAVPRDGVIKNGETDVTANYEISYEPSQPVTPPATEKIKLTVTAREPVSKDNGKTYEQNGAWLSAGALADGDAFVSIAIDVKQNEDGNYVATPRDGVIKNGETDVTANYEITYEPSKPVTPAADKIAITIRSKDRTAEYSGKPITAEEYEILSGALAEGDTIEVKYEGGSTNVTASPVASTIASVVIKDALGTDVTESKYAVTIDNDHAGKVTVTKHPITVTAITGTVETDGTKVIYAKDCKTANGSFTKGHKVEGLLLGHELRGDFVKGYGSETFVTSIDLTQLRVVDTANGDTDVTANYQVNTVDGKMTIKVSSKTGVPVAVTVKDQSWTYDGAAHRPDQSGYNISGLLDGDVATVTLQLKQNENQMEEATNAGTYSIVPVVSIKDKDGNAVSENKYKINATNGSLTVKKLDITLEAISDTKPYDGKALVNDKVKAPALAAGHKYQGVKLNVYDAKGNLIKNGAKEVGTYTKKITEVHIVDSKGVEVTDNYNITKVDGKLVITNSSKNDSKSPKTGDDSRPVLYIILIVASVILLAVIGVFLAMQSRRKKMLQPEPPVDGEYFEPDEVGNDWQDAAQPVEEEPLTPPASWNPEEAWKDLGKELDEDPGKDLDMDLDKDPGEGIDPLPEEPVHKPKH